MSPSLDAQQEMGQDTAERCRHDVQAWTTFVSLRYPNGRIHNTILTTSEELRPGREFDLHGRRSS
jgi:hypothetical protein